jgi:hypothetical protein
VKASEAARADLYTGLSEVLGERRAETLMSYLAHDPDEVATKTDLAQLKTELEAELKAEFDPQFAELGNGLAAVNVRLDRLFLTLLAGLFVIIATMASVLFTIG